MDKNGDHFLKDEFCYVSSVTVLLVLLHYRGFDTLTASIYHWLLRKQNSQNQTKQTQETPFIFRAFATSKALEMNNAEVIYAGMGTQGLFKLEPSGRLPCESP